MRSGVCCDLLYFCTKRTELKKLLFVISSCLLFSACIPSIDVFEKEVAIPGQQWQSSFRPEFSFTISDTSSSYDIMLVIRHTDAYNYNNIWLKATVQQPGETASRNQRYNLVLATNEKGWLGSAMDDIYEQRVLIQSQTRFKKTGNYLFTLEQIMREDPLQHVLNVGIRVEKSK
jgi:gliding motility-associated lipoprotein GldH